MLAELLGPHLVEDQAVALQRPHHDAHADDVGEARARGGEDRAEVGEQPLGFVVGVGRDRVRDRVRSEQRAVPGPCATAPPSSR